MNPANLLMAQLRLLVVIRNSEISRIIYFEK
jgi:hypothetical protein